MKLTFADSPDIDELNFKRLVLISNELAFVDRPSIQFADNFGTVGVPSGIRNLIKTFDGSPIKLIVDEPPNSVFNSEFYRKYFEKDLQNPQFLDTIFEGIDKGWIHDWHFVQEERSSTGEFQNYRQWLIDNQQEIKKTNLANIDRPKEISPITDKHQALFCFKIISAEQSLRVTSVLHICNKYESNPTSISPFLNKLISLRLSNDVYSGKTTKSRQLGLKIMDCIIPDEALIQIPWQDILDFRAQTKDYYDAWTIEVNKLEATLFKDNFSITDRDVLNLFDAEINPRLRELKNEIRRIKDERFQNILKTLKNTFLSSIALGTLSHLSVTGAIASFIGANLKTPKLTDDIIDASFKIKDRQLSNGLTYLLKVRELADK